MNDNKLIAEFMGRGGWFNHDETMMCTGVYPDTMTLMKYDTSWDWVMPVVQKCRLDGQNLVGIDNWIEIGSALDECNLDKTYQAVVEFIKTYNDEQ